jgi:hypothetical protein
MGRLLHPEAALSRIVGIGTVSSNTPNCSSIRSTFQAIFRDKFPNKLQYYRTSDGFGTARRMLSLGGPFGFSLPLDLETGVQASVQSVRDMIVWRESLSEEDGLVCRSV